MNVVTTKQFDKQLSKLSPKIKKALADKFEILSQNEFDERLHNHKLNPPFTDCKSINITGDYRLIYRKIDKETFLFYQIGTHSQLYE